MGTSSLQAFEGSDGDWQPRQLLEHLQQVPPDDPTAGAEINSIHALLEDGRVEPDRLYLLVSDADDVRGIARALQLYYRSGDERFDEIELCDIPDLSPDRPSDFKNRGLRNLVTTLVKLIRDELNRGRRPILNATPGFKAQAAYLTLVGQLMGVEVFYLFERFREIISLPPMPMGFDVLELWSRHYSLLEKLSREGVLEAEALEEELNAADERVRPLLEETEGLVALSPMGELFHEAIRESFRRQEVSLPPASDLPPDQKAVHYEDDNAGKHPGLSDFVDRLLTVEYVTQVRTWYYNPDLPRRITFGPSPRHLADGKENVLVAEYSNASQTTKLYVYTTAENQPQLLRAAEDLQERLGEA
ncbi:MAG: putative CRISPR-associated protein [Armatimonadota bacterium]|nr:putative CRISPR-associated protein [Armatimonadota bacterium]